MRYSTIPSTAILFTLLGSVVSSAAAADQALGHDRVHRRHHVVAERDTDDIEERGSHHFTDGRGVNDTPPSLIPRGNHHFTDGRGVDDTPPSLIPRGNHHFTDGRGNNDTPPSLIPRGNHHFTDGRGINDTPPSLIPRGNHHFTDGRGVDDTPPSLIPREESVVVPGRYKRDDGVQFALLGCIAEGSPALLTVQVPWNQTSLASCVSSCFTSSSTQYLFAGVLKGSECWCDGTDDASYSAIMSAAVQLDQSNCQDTCSASGDKWCGGESAYQLYYLPTTVTPSSSSSDPSDPTTTTTDDTQTPTTVIDTTTPADPTDTPTDPTASITPSVWTDNGIQYNYIGCYTDNTDSSSRILRGPSISNSPILTPSSCANYCYGLGYPVAGLEYANECYCGATAFTDLSSPVEGCNQPCSGDTSQACGAASQLALYTISDTSSIDEPTSLPTSTSGQWNSIGCYIDDTDNRVLPFTPTVDATTLSVDSCTDACTAAGYTVAGMEVGSQCYCGYDAPASWLSADSHDCDYPCPVGGGTCGGLLRLDVYVTA